MIRNLAQIDQFVGDCVPIFKTYGPIIATNAFDADFSQSSK